MWFVVNEMDPVFYNAAAAKVLSRLGKKRHLRQLNLLLEHPWEHVRRQAAVTIAAVAPERRASVADHLPKEVSKDDYHSEVREAIGASWEAEIPVSELFQIARQQRVVMIGEQHWVPGTGDHSGVAQHDAQLRVMRALHEGGGATWSLGIEPGVRDSLRREKARDRIVELAKELDWDVVELEQDWKSVGQSALRTRDRRAARTVKKLLRAPGRSLCIIYGQDHVIGKGHLGDLIGAKHMVILLNMPDWNWKIARKRQRVRLDDKAYRIREGVYYWPVQIMPGVACGVGGQRVLGLLDGLQNRAK